MKPVNLFFEFDRQGRRDSQTLRFRVRIQRCEICPDIKEFVLDTMEYCVDFQVLNL